jgi:hypothetical protein
MSNAKAWWATYAEKAAAKFYGNYAVMNNGWMESGITVLTGMPSKKYPFGKKTEQQVWNMINGFDGKNFIMTGDVKKMTYSWGLP